MATICYIFLEEKEEGDAVYLTWRQLFFLVDLLCCGAILFPVVWSIKHLEVATQIDGKAATNLKKLKIFKHFYIMVICYIYFTRIIGFLLKQILPFRYEWFDQICTELVTFTFFAMTAYKFQPAQNNPYLKLSQNEIDDDNVSNSNINGGGGDDDNGSAAFELQMNALMANEPDYITGNSDTVLDLTTNAYGKVSNKAKQDKSSSNATDGTQLPSGPNSSKPTLLSRKFQIPSSQV